VEVATITAVVGKLVDPDVTELDKTRRRVEIVFIERNGVLITGEDKETVRCKAVATKLF